MKDEEFDKLLKEQMKSDTYIPEKIDKLFSDFEKNKATQQSPKHFSQSILNCEIFLLSISFIRIFIPFPLLFKL